MQSVIIGVPLTLKDMRNIIENDVWERLGFSGLVSYYPVLNNVTRSMSSLVYRLNAIKKKFLYFLRCHMHL